MHGMSGVRVGRSRAPAVANRTHVHGRGAVLVVPTAGRSHCDHGGIVADVKQSSGQAVMVVLPATWRRRGRVFGRVRGQAARNASLGGSLNLHDGYS